LLTTRVGVEADLGPWKELTPLTERSERTKGTAGTKQPEQLTCRIRVDGQLGPEWSDWFDGLAVTPRPDNTTLLAGSVRDQPALHGLLVKVRDLGLSLISVDVAGAPAPPGPQTGRSERAERAERKRS
jgi:hypothetical protein